MSDKKYSVFISSTFEDLKEERETVLRAVLEHGHFPLGMELWGAADEQQWQIIKRQIDISDYYVIIIAQRYGSEHEGISWTEREYDYAVDRGVPVLGFLLAENAKWNASFVDKGSPVKKLNAFKQKVRSKPVSFWTNKEALRSEVILALSRQIQSTPRTGWIRASEGISSVTTNEIARLSEENSVLRAKVADLSSHEVPDIGFHIEAAELRLSMQEDRYPPLVSFRISVGVHATLRKGVAVGFLPKSALISFTADFGTSVPMKSYFTTAGGGTNDQLSISGPTAFKIHASSDYAVMDIPHAASIEVSVEMTPLGYNSRYRLVIPMQIDNKSRHQLPVWRLVDPSLATATTVPA